ncbi:thioredoxin domain-containing protein [Zhihengliuella flava]|uniref:Uncharacterized protein YyaL (SSP411 family) n=1 Tax=Zhihengliuella flava TaxID=1285193 RepID=A0A931D7T0_9MICC|nr:DUF255 domain-containing protein [Zhihengliuella flava]MBG6083992.1 uncharacterized protein YyaL (SSP411 family) [Zhihengliuella flava]
MANRLTDARSAYLRAHAHQHVDWWPYGEEAFAEAARRDVPVFLSIGYAACHWCHVMSAEVFDDADLAEALNRHCVAIKVDREEDPDVDAAYMAATQTLTGHGGWPLSVFALPDGRVFHAGTYFPPTPRHGLPAFGQVLAGVHEAWTERRAEVEEQAGHLADYLGGLADSSRDLLGLHVGQASSDSSGRSPAARAAWDGVLAQVEQDERPTGGFAPAPKFPPSSVLDFLLTVAGDDGTNPDLAARAEALAGRTLAALSTSGLYDHVGGGFARYCVDEAWRVPHFEKMLYDNAALLRHTARFAAATSGVTGPQAVGREAILRAARGTAEWLIRELLVRDSEGRPAGFASSLDADTVIEGRRVEGGTYLFSRSELRALAGEHWLTLEPLVDGRSPDAPTAAGRPADDVAATVAFAAPPSGAQWAAWDAVLPALRDARARRPHPARDEKVVASWNGLAVAALAEAGTLLGEPEWNRIAAAVAQYLWHDHVDPQCFRVRRLAYRRAGGMLEDYAGLALAFQAVATHASDAGQGRPGAHVWSERAGHVLEAACGQFGLSGLDLADGPDNSLLRSARGGRAGLEVVDSATPSPVALYASARAAQGAFDADAEAEREAARLVAHARRFGSRAPSSFGTALAVDVRLERAASLAVVGGHAHERRACLRWAALAGITAWASPDVVDAGPALGREKPAGPKGELRAYLCHGHVCAAPVESVEQLEAVRRRARRT